MLLKYMNLIVMIVRSLVIRPMILMFLKTWCFTAHLKFQIYFAILPVFQGNKNLGTVVIELQSKPLQAFASFPGLLIDKEINFEDEFNGYSYAFYVDNKLQSQSGSYVYNLINTDLQGQL